MATYFMMGKYTTESLKGISPERTQKAVDVIKKHGGEVKAMYALLGSNDLALIVEMSGTEEAVKTSIALTILTGIAFTTLPALAVEDFDKIAVG
jgi:uncharacterized protein with GYD domain